MKSGLASAGRPAYLVKFNLLTSMKGPPGSVIIEAYSIVIFQTSLATKSCVLSQGSKYVDANTNETMNNYKGVLVIVTGRETSIKVMNFMSRD